MEAKELRLGNWVNTGNFHLPKYKGNYQVKEEWLKYASKFKPVLITEEFKRQFEKDKSVLVDKLGFVIFKNGFAYQFTFEDYAYIHLIQNLYFALTNTELICTP